MRRALLAAHSFGRITMAEQKQAQPKKQGDTQQQAAKPARKRLTPDEVRKIVRDRQRQTSANKASK